MRDLNDRFLDFCLMLAIKNRTRLTAKHWEVDKAIFYVEFLKWDVTPGIMRQAGSEI